MKRTKKTGREFQKRGSIAVSVCWAQNEVGSAENGTNIFPKSHPQPCQEKQLGTLKTFYTCYIHILWKSSKSDLFVNIPVLVIFYLFCWIFPAEFAEFFLQYSGLSFLWRDLRLLGIFVQTGRNQGPDHPSRNSVALNRFASKLLVF